MVFTAIEEPVVNQLKTISLPNIIINCRIHEISDNINE